MKLRKAMALAVTAGLLAAGPALAQRRWIVEGDLDEVDSEQRTLEVNEQTLQVTLVTRIKDGDGKRLDWSDVEAREGKHVSILVVPGHPHPTAKTLVLADPISDD